MSFPNGLTFGSYGDERLSQSAKIGSLPLGARMVLPDGRMYAHAKAGGTTLVAGKLVMGEDTVDNNDTDQTLAAAYAVGASSITITLGDAEVTVNQYEDGYVIVNHGEDGDGEIYKIFSNHSGAASSTITITFEDGDTLVTAMKTNTSEIGLRVNEFQGCLLFDYAGLVGIPAGIPPAGVPADYYFWVQRRGAAGYLDSGGGTLGESLVASTGVDGSLETWIGAAAETSTENEPLGWCMTVQGDGEYGLMYLTLD